MKLGSYLLLAFFGTVAAGQTPLAAPVDGASLEAAAPEASVNSWLMRIHEAARQRSYVGTFVVSIEGRMSSARIWHACDGEQQVERVESLTGAPRSTFRRNDQVINFFPESRLAMSEKRESLGLFPNLLQSNSSSISQFYALKSIGRDRIAGFEADVAQLRPQDALRFGYRVWTEKKTGLVLKLQTLDGQGRVLEQAAFSEVQLEQPFSMAQLTHMMTNTEGYRVESPGMVKTEAELQGWVLKNGVPGFKSMHCYKRSLGVGADRGHENTLQWIFSDGLASVSLFIEAFDPQRHLRPETRIMGATSMVTRRLNQWWVTMVGEVPPQTLVAFAQGLARSK